MKTESDPSAENREGKILEEFDWEDKEGAKHQGVIRYAERNEADFDGVVAIDRDRSEFRWKAHEITPKTEEQIEAARKNLEESLDEPQKRAFIILKIDDEVVGYTEFGPVPEVEGTVGIFTTSVLQMNPKYKRKNEKGEERGYGFGEKLRTHAIKEAKDIFRAKRVESNVASWNKPSIALWEKLGSKRISETENKDKNGDPITVLDPATGQKIKSTTIRFRHLDE